MPIALLPDQQADQRHGDRQAHRDERAERDGEDDDRDGEADHLAAGLLRRPWRTPSRPLYSTCMPASRRLCGGRVRRVVLGRSILSVSNATVANAVRAVLADGRAARVVGVGHVDDVRARRRALLVASATAALAAGVVRPSCACTTTCAVWTLCCGNRSRSASAARCDSEPGSVNVSLVGPPIEPLSATAATAIRTQAASDPPRVAGGEVTEAVEKARHGDSLGVRREGGLRTGVSVRTESAGPGLLACSG